MDESSWAESCSELTAASSVPWVLLSASAEFDTFLRMVRVACQQGCTGVAVGRAVWQESTGLTGADRQQFLQDVAQPAYGADHGLVRRCGPSLDRSLYPGKGRCQLVPTY